MKNPIPKELCHYTKRDTALEKILFNKQLKLGRLGLTNDPKETKSRTISVISDSEKQYSIFDIAHRAERVMKEEWRVLCLTKHLRTRKGHSDRNHYLNFFAPGYCRPRMWAQYAENHSGVCLIFDGRRLETEIDSKKGKGYKVFCGAVSYYNYDSVTSKSIDFFDIETLGLLNGIRKHYYNFYKHYFLSKYPDWRDESEYRWLIHSPRKKADEFISIKGTLVAVLVGADFSKAYESLLKDLCKNLNVSAGRMCWKNGVPIAQFGSIYDPKDPTHR